MQGPPHPRLFPDHIDLASLLRRQDGPDDVAKRGEGFDQERVFDRFRATPRETRVQRGFVELGGRGGREGEG